MSSHKLFSTISFTASALTVWLYILFFIKPDKSDALLLSAFFLSFLVWLGSLFALAIYWLKTRYGNREIIYAHVKPSIRQGFLIAGTVAMLLFLQLFRVVSLWDALLVVIVAIVFELAAQQGKRNQIHS